MLIHTFVILSIIFSHCIGLCPNLHNITKKIANMLSLRRCNNQKQSGSSLATARKPTPSERDIKKAFVFLVIQEDESLIYFRGTTSIA